MKNSKSAGMFEGTILNKPKFKDLAQTVKSKKQNGFHLQFL